jgi:uncharacterized protein (TIGR02246 family)
MSGQDDLRDAVVALYRRVLTAWNAARAEDFAAPFADDGEVVGFDGSSHAGRDEIADAMRRIFVDHQTGTYAGMVKSVRPLGLGGARAAVVRAVAGLVPAGASDLEPKLNSQQALIVEERDGAWRVVLYQNTPAQFHGRPDLARALTDELRGELRAQQPRE